MANKQLLQSAGDGTAVPAGYVGEKITWTAAPANFTLSTSEADWTNANIVLTSGVWLVTANISVLYQANAGVGNAGSTVVKITDSSNAVVQNMVKLLYVGTNASSSLALANESCLSFSFVANLNATTTYKIRAYRTDSSGTGAGYLYNSGNELSHFFAVRIA